MVYPWGPGLRDGPPTRKIDLDVGIYLKIRDTSGTLGLPLRELCLTFIIAALQKQPSGPMLLLVKSICQPVFDVSIRDCRL